MPELLSSGRTMSPISYREYQVVVNSKSPTTEYHGTTHTRDGRDGIGRSAYSGWNGVKLLET
jgi:hypothetical protein